MGDICKMCEILVIFIKWEIFAIWAIKCKLGDIYEMGDICKMGDIYIYNLHVCNSLTPIHVIKQL